MINPGDGTDWNSVREKENSKPRSGKCVKTPYAAQWQSPATSARLVPQFYIKADGISHTRPGIQGCFI